MNEWLQMGVVGARRHRCQTSGGTAGDGHSLSEEAATGHRPPHNPPSLPLPAAHGVPPSVLWRGGVLLSGHASTRDILEMGSTLTPARGKDELVCSYRLKLWRL